MKRLYYENQYIKEFNAKIIDIKDINNKLHIALDKTAFFPGGGGQEKDKGKINNYEVVDVYEDEDIIYHVVEKFDYSNLRNNSEVDKNKEGFKKEINQDFNMNIDISLGEEANCSINFNYRLDGMHQHLGQHILSGTFYRLFGANTASIHLGKEISTVDIKGDISEEQIKEAEAYANTIIKENLKVNSFVPKGEELENLNLRRDLPNTDKEIRVLEIEGLDSNACCGVHPNNTLELRLIKIKKYEKSKGNTRIEFLVGDRAINDTLKEEKLLKEISILLSSKEEEEVIKVIENLKEESSSLRFKKNSLEEKIIAIEEEMLSKDSEKVGDYNLIYKDNSKEDLDYLRKLSNKLITNDKTIVMFIKNNKGKINVILGISKDIKNIEAGKLIKNNLHYINGKGGGGKFLAEAFGDAENLEEFKNSIIEEIHGYNS